MKTALLLIDIQKDYFKGGSMEVEGSLEAAGNAKKLLERFRAEKMPVVHIQHIAARPGATFFLPGTQGADFHEYVMPMAGESVFTKHYPNSFRSTGLSDMLERGSIKHLVIAGMMTQMCIDATTRAAFDLYYECTVISDACAARPQSFGGVDVEAARVHAAFLSALAAVYARVVPTDEYLSGFAAK